MCSKVEYGVEMGCDACVASIKKLMDLDGIDNIDVNLEECSVVVDTTLPIMEVSSLLAEKSCDGKAVIKGIAGLTSAFVFVEPQIPDIEGEVYFSQINPDTVIVDGIIEGLKPGNHGLFIHETEDLTQICNSVGEPLDPDNKSGIIQTNLGCITSDDETAAPFRFERNINLDALIGKYLVVTEKWDDVGPNFGSRLVCGILERSFCSFENPNYACKDEPTDIKKEEFDESSLD